MGHRRTISFQNQWTPDYYILEPQVPHLTIPTLIINSDLELITRFLSY